MKKVADLYYNQGMSLEKIGKLLGPPPKGVTGMTVRRQMMRAGLSTRPLGFNSARGRAASRARWGSSRDDFKYTKIIDLGKEHPAPYPIALIAREAGVSYSWACHVLTRENLRPRKFTRKRKEEEEQ
jgi:transposase